MCDRSFPSAIRIGSEQWFKAKSKPVSTSFTGCQKSGTTFSKLHNSNRAVCFQPIAADFTLRVESPSIFLDQSGRGRRLCTDSPTFRVEHALKKPNVFGCQSRVTSNRKTTKPKQTLGIFSKNSGKRTTTMQGIISFETQDCSRF